ncbi:hypothetical protein AB0I68_14260 [Streptomyces sp. NPDC050448]|uniref:hypothetical protein n=1 Tax=Streptomyces sp. NPDC050448 TaxID=3155404 RepID=UPI00342D2F4B
MRHYDFLLHVQPVSTTLAKADATFHRQWPLRPAAPTGCGRTQRLRNRPCACCRRRNRPRPAAPGP